MSTNKFTIIICICLGDFFPQNHGAASCTNRWIPDHGSAIYRSKKNKDKSNVPLSKYKRKVADLGVSLFGNSLKNPDGYPKPGYQNAPNFCRDTDKSMGSYSFNIPRKLSPGETILSVI